jgi:hypothetical protein
MFTNAWLLLVLLLLQRLVQKVQVVHLFRLRMNSLCFHLNLARRVRRQALRLVGCLQPFHEKLLYILDRFSIRDNGRSSPFVDITPTTVKFVFWQCRFVYERSPFTLAWLLPSDTGGLAIYLSALVGEMGVEVFTFLVETSFLPLVLIKWIVTPA